MSEKLTVEILEGKHSKPAPNGTEKLFKNLLEKSGFKNGDFKILLGRQIRGACGAKKIMVHNLDEQTGTIMIKAQINGKKDQRFEFFLTLPNQFNQKPEVFLEALRRGADLINKPPEIQPAEKDQQEENVLEIKEVEKEKTFKRAPRGVGFDHFIADEESIYLFWLEIRELFQGDKKMATRKELTDNFLINYGHFSSCYRFISKLIQLKIFSETKSIGGNKRDLLVGKKLEEIISKVEKGSAKEKPLNTFAEKINRLQLLVDNKKKTEDLILEKENQIKVLQEDLGMLLKKITPEMQEAEEKLEALKKLLG